MQDIGVLGTQVTLNAANLAQRRDGASVYIHQLRVSFSGTGVKVLDMDVHVHNNEVGGKRT